MNCIPNLALIIRDSNLYQIKALHMVAKICENDGNDFSFSKRMEVEPAPGKDFIFTNFWSVTLARIQVALFEIASRDGTLGVYYIKRD